MQKKNLINMPGIEMSSIQKAAMKSIERSGEVQRNTQIINQNLGVEAPAIVSGSAAPPQDLVKVNSGEFNKRNQATLLSFGKISSSASSRHGQKKRTGNTPAFKKGQGTNGGANNGDQKGKVFAGALTQQNLLKFQALQKQAERQRKADNLKNLLDASIENDQGQNNRIHEGAPFAPNFTVPKQDSSLMNLNKFNTSSGRYASISKNKTSTSRQLSSDFNQFGGRGATTADKQIIIPKKNSRSRCTVDLDMNIGHRKHHSVISSDAQFVAHYNQVIKSSTNVSQNKEVQQLPLTMHTLNLLQQPAKNDCINLLLDTENNPDAHTLQFARENKRAVSAASMVGPAPRRRKHMMSQLPSQSHLYPRRQLGPSTSALSKEAELITGKRIQNMSKLVVSSGVKDFDDPLLSLNARKHQSSQQYSQQMYLLRQSEKLIKQGQQVPEIPKPVATSCTIYNLDDPTELDNVDIGTSWRDNKVLEFAARTQGFNHQRSISPSIAHVLDASAQFLPQEVVLPAMLHKKKQQNQKLGKTRDSLNSSMGLHGTQKTGQSKMMTAAAQQRKFLNGAKNYATNPNIFRPKSATGTSKPPMAKKRTKPQANQPPKPGGDQFQEYLDSNLVDKVTKTSKAKQQLASTTLNILTASNTVALQTSNSPQHQQGVVAKKQQKMLLKESNKAVKRTQLPGRTKSKSVIGLPTKNNIEERNPMHRPTTAIRNSQSSDIKRKNKSQSPGTRSNRILTQTTKNARVSISHSSATKSKANSEKKKKRTTSEKLRAAARLQSSEKTVSRHNFSHTAGSHSSKSKVQSVTRSISNDRRSSKNRRTVECLIADQLRDQPINRLVCTQNQTKSIELIKGGESEASLAPFLQNVLDLFAGAELSQSGPKDHVEKEQALEQILNNMRKKDKEKAKKVDSTEKSVEQVQKKIGVGANSKNSLSFANMIRNMDGKETKLDKIIKQNLRRHKAQIDELRTRHAIKLEQEREKKANIELANQRVRRENRDEVLRRKNKVSQERTLKDIHGGEKAADYNEFSTSQTHFVRKKSAEESVDSKLARTEKNIQRVPFQRPRTQFKILGGATAKQPKVDQLDLRTDEDGAEHERSNSQRRSTCGLDFIEVRREIAAELRADVMGERIKLLKTSVSLRNMSQKKEKSGMAQSSESIKKTVEQLTEKFTNRLQIMANRTQKHKISIPALTALQEQSPAQQQQSQGLQKTQIIKEVNEDDRPVHLKKEQIRKFIKDKKKKDKKVLKREQAAEIKTILQVKENLLKLNRFVAVANVVVANKNKQLGNTTVNIREGEKSVVQGKLRQGKPSLNIGKKKQNVSMIHHKLSKRQLKVEKVKDNMGTLTPSNQLPFENSEKSFRMQQQRPDNDSQIFSGDGGLKRSDYVQNYSQLYEESQTEQVLDSQVKTTDASKRGTSSGGIDSNYNPLRRVLQPNFQESEKLQQHVVKASKFKHSRRSKVNGSAQYSYFEHSSRDSSSNSRQAAFLRLKPQGGQSKSPQISRKSSSQSPPRENMKSQTQQIKKVTVKPKPKKVTPFIKIKQQSNSSNKIHQRSRSRDVQPKSNSSSRELQPRSNARDVQPKSTTTKVTKKILVQPPTKVKKHVRHHKLTVEQAATKIQLAVKKRLLRTGFYQKHVKVLSSLDSPEKTLIDLHIDRESDESFDPDGLNVQIIIDMDSKKKKKQLSGFELPSRIKKGKQLERQSGIPPHISTNERERDPNEDLHTNPNLLTVSESHSSTSKEEVAIQEQTEFIAVRQGVTQKPSIQAKLKAMMDNEPDEDTSMDQRSISNAKSSDCVEEINRQGKNHWLNKNHMQGQHKSAQELERVDEMMQKPPPLQLVHEEQDEHHSTAGLGNERQPSDPTGAKRKQLGLSPQTHSDRFTDIMGMLHQPSQLSIESKEQSGSSNVPPILSNNNKASFLGQLQSKESKSQASEENKSQNSSKTSSSLFDRNAFQNLSRQKLANLMHNNEYQQLIKFREDWLEYRKIKENKAIYKLLQTNKCSPRTYQEKKNQIDKWVDIQRQDLQTTKMVFQQEWDKTVQMIEETQKDVDLVKAKVNINSQQVSKESKSGGSIFTEDPPKSYRSGQQSLVSGSQGLSNLMALGNGIFDGVKSDKLSEDTSLIKKMLQIPVPDEDDRSNQMQHEPSQELLERLEKAFSKNSGAISKRSDDGESDNQALERLLACKMKEDNWSPVDLQKKTFGEGDILLEQVIRDFNDEPLSSGKEKSGPLAPLANPPPENFRDSVMIINDDGGKFEKVDESGTDSPSVVKIGLGKDMHGSEAAPTETDKDTGSVEDSVENADYIKPPKELLSSNLTEPEICSPPKKQKDKKEGEEEETKSYSFENKSFDNEPAIISGQSATFETQPDPYCLNTPAAGLVEPAIHSTSTGSEGQTSANKMETSNDSTTESRLNLYADKSFTDIEDLFENHQTSQSKEDLVDHITEALLQDVLKELHWNFPPERKVVEKKKAAEKKNKAQGDASEIYVVDLTFGQKEERREWIEQHHRHLIERELYQSDTYIGEALERLLMYEIDTSEDSDDDYSEKSEKSKKEPLTRFAKESPLNLHIQFLQALTQPILRNKTTLLRSLQQQEGPSYAHFETSFNTQKYPIIPVDLYLEVERQRDEDDQYDRSKLKEQLNSSAELSVVIESVHIQNKCYFDALNESLMKFRPYGITGEPMPWSTKIRRLQTKVDINSVDTERLFQMVKHDVFRWASAFCGTLPTSDFLLPTVTGKQRKAEAKFNDELFQETRDKRLSQVLHSETVEQEHHWLNFEFEESQVKVDLTDCVLDHLINEIALFLSEKEGHDFVPPKKKFVKDEMPAEQPSKLDALFGDLQKYTSSEHNIIDDALLLNSRQSGEESKKALPPFASSNLVVKF